MPVPGAALSTPTVPLPLLPRPTMSSFDDDACVLSLSGTRAEASFELRRQRQHVHGAATSPPPRGRGARAVGGIRCQGYYCCRRAKAGCAHRRCGSCCRRRGFVCPAHAHRLPRVPATSGCSERQQVHAAPAADRKRPRALPSAATATPTTTTSSSSSVDQPTMDTAVPPAGWFAREVSLDAVFRRVRLMGPEAEVAYHTTVTIAGHVFRGVLYDVGPHSRSSSTAVQGTVDDGSCDGSSRSTARGSCQLDLTLSL